MLRRHSINVHCVYNYHYQPMSRILPKMLDHIKEQRLSGEVIHQETNKQHLYSTLELVGTFILHLFFGASQQLIS